MQVLQNPRKDTSSGIMSSKDDSNDIIGDLWIGKICIKLVIFVTQEHLQQSSGTLFSIFPSPLYQSPQGLIKSLSCL